MKTYDQINDTIKWGCCLLVLLTVGTLPAGTDDSFRDLFADTWVATDALGRTLPAYEEVGPPREGKVVGMFYYTWHGFHDETVYDITRLLAENPENPKWGPQGHFHFWGEPEYGYFRAEDPWVIRHDLQMLSIAGIDFIFFDVTNAFIYLDTVIEPRTNRWKFQFPKKCWVLKMLQLNLIFTGPITY